MSTGYSYDIFLDTANGRVNLEVLARAILNAGLASGGDCEGVEVNGGTLDDTRAGVIVGGGSAGGTITVTWENALSGADELAQDTLVSDEQGEGFAAIVPQSVESLSMGSTGSSMIKLALTPAGPLAEGTYQISAFAEIRTQAVIATSYARGSVLIDNAEITQSNNPDDAFTAFGIDMLHAFEAGETPVIEITLEAVGAPNTVEIRGARIAFSRVLGY